MYILSPMPIKSLVALLQSVWLQTLSTYIYVYPVKVCLRAPSNCLAVTTSDKALSLRNAKVLPLRAGRWQAGVLIPQNVALSDESHKENLIRPQLLLLGKRRDHHSYKFQELGMPRSAKGKAQREKALGVECG